MLRPVSELRGLTIQATDGDIGHVDQFYFEDETWTVRYLVVDTGTWLPGRQVLISPVALGEIDWHGHKLPVNLTRKQVEESPDIDTDKPVSRQHERDYFQYYGWPYYWIGSGLWGSGMYPGFLATPVPAAPVEGHETGSQQESGDPHLRATGEVAGYRVQAHDGEIGHVDDFVVDIHTWALRYVVVDTRNWWPGRKVLLPTAWIESVSWAEEAMKVDLSRQTIKDAPAWNPPEPITREYEARLYGYYGRPNYWDAPEVA
jgi:PRC-barrel domain protein